MVRPFGTVVAPCAASHISVAVLHFLTSEFSDCTLLSASKQVRSGADAHTRACVQCCYISHFGRRPILIDCKYRLPSLFAVFVSIDCKYRLPSLFAVFVLTKSLLSDCKLGRYPHSNLLCPSSWLETYLPPNNGGIPYHTVSTTTKCSNKGRVYKIDPHFDWLVSIRSNRSSNHLSESENRALEEKSLSTRQWTLQGRDCVLLKDTCLDSFDLFIFHNWMFA